MSLVRTAALEKPLGLWYISQSLFKYRELLVEYNRP
jgi:hypothetical protein